MTDFAQLDNNQVLQYINLLINSHQVDDAALIWKKYYPSDTLLYNGRFSFPLVKSGFGWRVWSQGLLDNEIDVEVLNQNVDKTALHIHFNGKENVHFRHIKQIVPLSSGQSFTLSGEIRSKNLTTDQRPFLEVIGRPSGEDCSMRFTTEMVEENQDWTPFALDFTVPDECSQGVEIRLRRLPSQKIDSLISGDLWLTHLSLENAPHNTLQ